MGVSSKNLKSTWAGRKKSLFSNWEGNEWNTALKGKSEHF